MTTDADIEKHKTFDCFRGALNEFRLRHGLEAYRAHVLPKNDPYGLHRQHDTPGFEDILGGTRMVSRCDFARPMTMMLHEIRNHRHRLSQIKDTLLDPEKKELCLEVTRSAISSWSITYQYGKVEYVTGKMMPGLISSNIFISPCRTHMVRDVGNVVDEKFILDLRNRKSTGDHTTAEVVALVQRRHDGSHNRGYYLVEIRGHVAWLPDAIKESLAFGNSRERAVRTSRDRMIRFIDKRLKGERK
jgi:hypothetical protein